MIKYNLDYLLKIKLEDFRENKHYTFKYKPSNFLGLFGTPAGFYCNYFKTILITDALPKNMIIKDNILLMKPKVTLCFVDRTCVEHDFNTYEEAVEFYTDILNKSGNINRFIK